MTDRIITSNFSSLTNMEPFDLTDCAGDFASDFDMNAASYDYTTKPAVRHWQRYGPNVTYSGMARSLARSTPPI